MLTLEHWVAKHPYLEPMARLDTAVEHEIARVSFEKAATPSWDRHSADFLAGVPLLEGGAVTIDLAPVERAVPLLAERLVSRNVVAAEAPGLMRYLHCRLLSRYLSSIVGSFASWRQEDRWLRHYCPVCGSPPAMAQLIGADPGRLRLLSCGSCGNRWRYRRTGCPFCRNEDDHLLAVVVVEGQGGLRIDYCEQCRGYLKTYDGEGGEGVLLADWTSIQLDMIALDRGLKRMAASLYTLEC
jgi:FdhE protein